MVWRKERMGEISRNNHYVPQFYLENWSTNKKLWKYQLLVSSENVPIWSCVSVKYTASQDNLYVRVEKESEMDDFEKMFDYQFESVSKNAIEKAINDEKLSMEDWSKLINFVGAQIVRTPAFYQKTRPIIKQAMENGLTGALNKLSHLMDIPKNKTEINKFDELIPIKYYEVGDSEEEGYKNIKFESIEGKSTWLWTIQHLLGEPLEILHQHKWSIITCDEELPTSDDPVICLNYYDDNDYNFNGGWKQKGTEILCPISPHKILYTQVGRRNPPRMKYDKKQSKLLKKIIVMHAFREIYAFNEDAEIPSIRNRHINAEKYKEEKKIMEEWYNDYIYTEGAML